MLDLEAQSDPPLLVLRSDGLAWQDVGDQVVILDLVTSRYLEINASGALIFRLIADGTTLPDLAAALMNHFDLTADQAMADAQLFVAGLDAQGLLQTR